MADGHLNKCIVCTKKDVKRRYYDPDSREKIIAYERNRAQQEQRKKNVLEYQKTSRQRNRGKYKARQKLNNSLRSGRITKQPCEVCGESRAEAHHPDYRSPLKVWWLCRKHHLEEENKIPF